MPSQITILEGINTLRSVRQFKPDPVPRELVDKILEAASKAASGSNTQPWEFMVVMDQKVKARLTGPMLETWTSKTKRHHQFHSLRSLVEKTFNYPATYGLLDKLVRSAELNNHRLTLHEY